MDKTYYKSIDETVIEFRACNGLEVHVINKKGFSNKAAYFATKFGSFNTGDSLADSGETVEIIGGLAHFLEHRVFDYKDGNIIDLFYKLGADVNAFTSYDRTVYYFSTIDNFEKCLELLLDFPTSFTMSEDAVEGEKDIIVNELLMYKDDPNDKLFKGLMNALYINHPIRYDVGGEPEEVRKTTRALLKKVHSHFYNPKNMCLVIVGDVDVEKIREIVNKKEFKSIDYNYTKCSFEERIDVVKDNVIIKDDVTNRKLLIGYKLPPLDNLECNEIAKTYMCLDLLTSILFSSSSDFYKNLIEEKYVSSLGVELMQYEGMFSLLLEMDILKSSDEVYKKINDRLNDTLNVINEEKLNSIKKKEIAICVRSSDSCSRLAKNYINLLLEGFNYCTTIDLIKSINLQDLKNTYTKYILNSKSVYALLEGKNEN